MARGKQQKNVNLKAPELGNFVIRSEQVALDIDAHSPYGTAALG